MSTIFIPITNLGLQRISLLENSYVAMCCSKDTHFKNWMNEKFLSYQWDRIVDNDIETLEDAVRKCLIRLITDKPMYVFLVYKFEFALRVLNEECKVCDDEMWEVREVFDKTIAVISSNIPNTAE